MANAMNDTVPNLIQLLIEEMGPILVLETLSINDIVKKYRLVQAIATKLDLIIPKSCLTANPLTTHWQALNFLKNNLS